MTEYKVASLLAINQHIQLRKCVTPKSWKDTIVSFQFYRLSSLEQVHIKQAQIYYSRNGP